MSVTTNGLPAVSIIGQELGLVAHADLTHLDARPELSRQVFDQFSEVDPVFRKVIKDQPLSTQYCLDIDELELQFLLVHKLTAELETRLSKLLQFHDFGEVCLLGFSQNDALRRVFKERLGLSGAATKYFAQLDAPVGANHDLIASRDLAISRRLKIAKNSHMAESDHKRYRHCKMFQENRGCFDSPFLSDFGRMGTRHREYRFRRSARRCLEHAARIGYSL